MYKKRSFTLAAAIACLGAVSCSDAAQEQVAAGRVQDAAPSAPADPVRDRQLRLEALARQLNPATPEMVDPATRLDAVTAGTDGNTLHYRYAMLDPAAIAAVKADGGILREHVTGFVCANLDKSSVLREGFIFDMAYTDVQGVEVTRFDVVPSNCP